LLPHICTELPIYRTAGPIHEADIVGDEREESQKFPDNCERVRDSSRRLLQFHELIVSDPDFSKASLKAKEGRTIGMKAPARIVGDLFHRILAGLGSLVERVKPKAGRVLDCVLWEITSDSANNNQQQQDSCAAGQHKAETADDEMMDQLDGQKEKGNQARKTEICLAGGSGPTTSDDFLPPGVGKKNQNDADERAYIPEQMAHSHGPACYQRDRVL
jgi:hypothetical protein